MAAIDWDAAITALNSGDLPCSGGERRILQLSASLAAGIPVSLRDTVTGLDTTTPPGCSPQSGMQPETTGAQRTPISTLDEHAARRQAQGNRLQPSTERPPARHRASGVSRTGVMRGRVIAAVGRAVVALDRRAHEPVLVEHMPAAYDHCGKPLTAAVYRRCRQNSRQARWRLA